MPFPKGVSGNPKGRKKALGLSRPVRASQGLETWAKLLQARDGLIKQIDVDENGNPVYGVLDYKQWFETCKLILAYCWGQPAQKIDFESEEGKAFAFAVLINPEAEAMLKNEQRSIRAPVRPDGISFDFGG